MNRHIRPVLCLGAVLLVLTGTPQLAHADGIAITVEESKVEMPGQQAIIVWDAERGREDLILSVSLLGGLEAAWVVPVPSLPEVKAASPDWFPYLVDVTRPTIVYRDIYRDWVCGREIIETVQVEKEVGVELFSRQKVGVYDVSILSADEPRALLDWLNDNGYAFPEDGEPLLDAYIEEGGWYFVAARVLSARALT